MKKKGDAKKRIKILKDLVYVAFILTIIGFIMAVFSTVNSWLDWVGVALGPIFLASTLYTLIGSIFLLKHFKTKLFPMIAIIISGFVILILLLGILIMITGAIAYG